MAKFSLSVRPNSWLALVYENFEDRGFSCFLPVTGAVGVAVLWGCANSSETGRDVYPGDS